MQVLDTLGVSSLAGSGLRAVHEQAENNGPCKSWDMLRPFLVLVFFEFRSLHLYKALVSRLEPGGRLLAPVSNRTIDSGKHHRKTRFFLWEKECPNLEWGSTICRGGAS